LAERRREFSRELDALARRGLMLGLSTAELLEQWTASVERVSGDESLTDIVGNEEKASP
jgi:hypothetical protein